MQNPSVDGMCCLGPHTTFPKMGCWIAPTTGCPPESLFNTQKNSGLNLEHAYSHICWASYYFLLQSSHLLLQLVEKGSLLRQWAQEQGKRSALELYGSLKNMAQRLLESLRYWRWPDAAFDRTAAGAIQIRLDSS
jgi:hypothetical protein